MADSDAQRDGTATEAPTPRRREQARAEGRIPHSLEFATGGHLLLGWLVLSLCGPGIADNLARSLFVLQQTAIVRDLDVDRSVLIVVETCDRLFDSIWGPLLGLVCGVLVLAVAQLGGGIHPQPIQFRWERLDIGRGLGRIFSWDSTGKGLWAIVRLVLCLAVTLWSVWVWRQRIASAGSTNPLELSRNTWEMSLALWGTLAGVTFVIGAIDYGLQWFKNERQLRMTREELKQEFKEEQGDPHLKSLIRKRQREQIKQRSIKHVPQATVVIANPTHIAIAIKYQWGQSQAPVVLAKGTGDLALRIKEIARRHHIQLVENKPLARAIYGSVEIGQPIPVEFYRAVAEILAQLQQRRVA